LGEDTMEGLSGYGNGARGGNIERVAERIGKDGWETRRVDNSI